MKTQHGFTLIELMIVVVVVAILSAIALPSYQDYVTRSKIPDAISNLAGKRVQMEQFFQDNRTYLAATACNNDTTSSQYFDFSCSVAATATTYTLAAVGKGTMAGFSYTVNESNVKTSTIGSPAKASWQATSATCWITNTGGAC